MREYVPLYGPKGIVVKVYEHHIWIGGSNHWLHWLHHIIPGAKRREIDCGIEIANLAIREAIGDIRGLSIGGCIAQIAATVMLSKVMMILPSVTTYGTKRAPRGYAFAGLHYRHRGDPVPWLPPWRPSVQCIVIGKWEPIWIAHAYKELR